MKRIKPILLIFILIFCSCSSKEQFEEVSSSKFSLKVIGEFQKDDWVQIDNVKFTHVEYDVPFDEVAFDNFHSFDGEIHTIKLPVSKQKVFIAEGIEKASIYRDTDFLTFYIRFLNAAILTSTEQSNSQEIPYRFEAGAMLHLQKKLQFWKNNEQMITIKYSPDYPIALEAL